MGACAISPEDKSSSSCFPKRLFDNTVNDMFICPIDSQIFYDPITDACGHTFCRPCFDNWIDSGETSCPLTKQPLDSLSSRPNYVIRDHINTMIIGCHFKDRGCKWQGMVEDLQSHFENDCGEVREKCPNKICGNYFPRRYIDEHMNLYCSYRTVECEDCQTPYLFHQKLVL